MKKEEKTQKSKLWVDHSGQTVPEKYISSYDRLKERKLNQIIKTAEKLNKQLLTFKSELFAVTDDLYDMLFKEHNMERTGKGNYTLYNFDKSIKVEVTIQDIVDFDDKITVAQAKIQHYLDLKLKDVDQDLSILVNNAFKTRKGRLDKARIFGLFQLKITHPVWLEAMELIKQSITTNSTRRYAQ
ncbi:MAG: DUF3164 family protein, partial [Clostridia bacterium]|nr:DUF3164 family protein [Clostridia bacterium]